MIECIDYFQEFTDHHKYLYLCDVCKEDCLKYEISKQEFEMIVQ